MAFRNVGIHGWISRLIRNPILLMGAPYVIFPCFPMGDLSWPTATLPSAVRFYIRRNTRGCWARKQKFELVDPVGRIGVFAIKSAGGGGGGGFFAI